MRRYTHMVLDEVVVGTDPAYTTFEYNDILGSTDELAIQVVVDEVSGTGSLSITVQIEHSADGRNWLNKSTSAEINGMILSTSSTRTFFGSDAGSTPTLGLVRLRVVLGGTTPVAHVKLHVTGRDEGWGDVDRLGDGSSRFNRDLADLSSAGVRDVDLRSGTMAGVGRRPLDDDADGP